MDVRWTRTRVVQLSVYAGMFFACDPSVCITLLPSLINDNEQVSVILSCFGFSVRLTFNLYYITQSTSLTII